MKKSIIWCLTFLIVACNQTITDNKENDSLKEKKINKRQETQSKEERKTEEEFVYDIRKKYEDVNGKINSYKKIQNDLMEQSSEGGNLERYYNNGELKKIVSTYYGEMGQIRAEYYFFDNNLFFVFTQKFSYNVPMYMDGSKEDKIEGNRYYFHNDKLIRWLDPNKKKVAKSQFAQKEIEILRNMKELREKAK